MYKYEIDFLRVKTLRTEHVMGYRNNYQLQRHDASNHVFRKFSQFLNSRSILFTKMWWIFEQTRIQKEFCASKFCDMRNNILWYFIFFTILSKTLKYFGKIIQGWIPAWSKRYWDITKELHLISLIYNKNAVSLV